MEIHDSWDNTSFESLIFLMTKSQQNCRRKRIVKSVVLNGTVVEIFDDFFETKTKFLENGKRQ